jgi:hypothetical protein
MHKNFWQELISYLRMISYGQHTKQKELRGTNRQQGDRFIKIKGGLHIQTDTRTQTNTQTETDGYKDREQGNLISLLSVKKSRLLTDTETRHIFYIHPIILKSDAVKISSDRFM